MANANNKHKAQGKKPVVKKESWWTPERVKIAIAAIVVVILFFVGLGIYNYVSGLQDSIVGDWSHKYADSDTADEMEVVFTFNEDKSCSFVRYRNGEKEANMTGSYSIDDTYDIVTLMLGSDMSTVMQYYYDCEDNDLQMKNFTTGVIDNYVKVTE